MTFQVLLLELIANFTIICLLIRGPCTKVRFTQFSSSKFNIGTAVNELDGKLVNLTCVLCDREYERREKRPPSLTIKVACLDVKMIPFSE